MTTTRILSFEPKKVKATTLLASEERKRASTMLSLLKKKGGRVVVMLHLDSLQGQKSMPTTPNPFFLTFGVVEALCLTRISLLEWSRRFVPQEFHCWSGRGALFCLRSKKTSGRRGLRSTSMIQVSCVDASGAYKTGRDGAASRTKAGTCNSSR